MMLHRFNLIARSSLLFVFILLSPCRGADETTRQGDQRTETAKPNVLFIAIDDLNDWVSLFGGHPQARTPNFDRLAQQGAIVFQTASCAGPVCGPSRSALLSGYMPHRSGVYGNSQNMLHSKLIASNPTLPEYFSQHGYNTISRGKIFHSHGTVGGIDRGQWAFQNWSPGERGIGADPKKVTSRDRNLIAGKKSTPSQYTRRGGSEFAFGPSFGDAEEMSDYKTAKWAAEWLQQPSHQPFFLAVGLFRPHLPFYVPQSYFDLYPIDEIVLPSINEDDLTDIRTLDGRQKFSPSNDYLWLKEKEQMRQVVQAYLAAISFADACLGEILDGLNQGPHADDTIVVVWGDHGWHLGEKLRFRKATGFREATRCPLVIRTPAMAKRTDCQRPVNLIDLYPTLIEYCGLPPKQDLDGQSMVPLLSDPSAKVRDYATTIFGYRRAAITDGDWHYARHEDGTEELYDLTADPQGWTNLVTRDNERVQRAKQRLSGAFPKQFVEPIAKTPVEVKKAAKGLNPELKWPRVLK